ncbi:T9SS type B sorting domain-containing protein [Nonlabens xiamenensis]|uniref:T9SS type B sorting domain-containing protein n=1 Tax=Nonlabens xiamenensis TaxID=2341043 RepID=UPI000F60E6BC|nr:T9SS type B sorting domain-containing protein [Nonlabens xiamenensis]
MKALFPLVFLLYLFSNAQNPNDCSNAILLCGDTNIGIDPSGVGMDEFSLPGNPVPSCYNFRADQAWFRVEIEMTGDFTFEIIPDVALADYDFAIFGPTTDCSNLGPAIRCSSTNPTNAGVSGNTGLNDTETDVNEGPGPNGNGFLASIPANTGEVYYILVGLAVGNGGFSMSTGGTAQLPPVPSANAIPDIETCDNLGPQDGFREFDFSSLDADILQGQNNTTVSYHESLNDANIGINPISFPFINTINPQTIFARVERSDSNCTDFTDFTVVVDDTNTLDIADPIIICSTNSSEVYDLANVIDQWVPNPSDVNITYHLSSSDAENDLNPQSSVFTATTTLTSYFIKVIDPTGLECEYVIEVPLRVANPPAAANPPDLENCDDDFDAEVGFDLREQDMVILNGLDASLHQIAYYASPTDRTNESAALSNPYVNVQNPQQIYARVTESSTQCFTDVSFQIRVLPKPALQDQEDIIVCVDAEVPTLIGVEAGFEFYQWSTGEMGDSFNEISIDQPGDYSVTVTNTFGCESSLTITALASDIAVLDDIIIQDFRNGDNTAEFIVSGPGEYEFAVDDGFYQASNFFSGLYKGFHTVRIRDKNGCGVLISEFVVLDYQQFFTPNGDGFHDTWTFDGITAFPEAVIFIYDRNGKLLHQMAPEGPGWNGTYLGNPLPSSTYWFSLEIPNKPLIKGYFALKR